MSVDRTVELQGIQGWINVFWYSRPNGMAFSSDGKLLAVGFKELVRLWNTTTGTVINSFPDDGVECLSFSPNGQSLVFGVRNGGVTLWNVEKRRGSTILNSHGATAVTFSPDGEFIAVGLSDHTSRLLNVNLGAARGPSDSKSSRIVSLCFSANSSLIASASYNGTVKLWDTKAVAACPN
jgi:WD40 repeat protein